MEIEHNALNIASHLIQEQQQKKVTKKNDTKLRYLNIELLWLCY